MRRSAKIKGSGSVEVIGRFRVPTLCGAPEVRFGPNCRLLAEMKLASASPLRAGKTIAGKSAQEYNHKLNLRCCPEKRAVIPLARQSGSTIVKGRNPDTLVARSETKSAPTFFKRPWSVASRVGRHS